MYNNLWYQSLNKSDLIKHDNNIAIEVYIINSSKILTTNIINIITG